MRVTHTFLPIYDEYSKVLILGSIPSIKSREVGFYFSHPKNRFWSTLASVYHVEIGNSIDEKITFLHEHHIALFDVIKSCDITSSSDSSIKNVIPNDISKILNKTQIKTIFTVGKKASQLYQKYLFPKTTIESICLPSTSPANCPKGIEEILFNSYQQIKEYTDK